MEEFTYISGLKLNIEIVINYLLVIFETMRLFVLILAFSFIAFSAALTGKIFTPKMNFTSNPSIPNLINLNSTTKVLSKCLVRRTTCHVLFAIFHNIFKQFNLALNSLYSYTIFIDVMFERLCWFVLLCWLRIQRRWKYFVFNTKRCFWN